MLKSRLIKLFTVTIILASILPSGVLTKRVDAADPSCGGITSPGNPFSCCSNGGNCTFWAGHKRSDLAALAAEDFAAGLSGWNAKEWIARAEENSIPVVKAADIPSDGVKGYSVEGAIAVWTNSGYGHVAYVEADYENGKVKLSDMHCDGKTYGVTTGDFYYKSYLGTGGTFSGFILKPPSNLKTVITSPANGSTQNSVGTGFNITVDLQNTGSNQFQLLIDDNADFSSTLINQSVTGTTFNVSNYVPGKYYAKALGQNTSTTNYLWSDVVEFNVNNYARDKQWPADVNGDGKLDLIKIGTEGDIWVSESDGNGNFPVFQNKTTTTTYRGNYAQNWFSDTYQQRQWAVDIDNNGIVDLLGVNDEGKIVVSLGNKVPNTTPVQYSYGKDILGPYVEIGSPPTDCALAIGAECPPYTPPSDELAPMTMAWFGTDMQPRIWPMDFDRDSDIDLVGFAKTNEIRVFEFHRSMMRYEQAKTIKAYGINAGYWFRKDINPRIWPVDYDSDQDIDFLGVNDSGQVYLLESTASQLRPAKIPPGYEMDDSAIYKDAAAIGSPILNTTQFATIFKTDTQQRFWPVKVNDDQFVDFLYFNDNGDVRVSLGRGLTGFDPVTTRAVQVLPAAYVKGWFSKTLQPRLWLVDFNADNFVDVVGVNGTGYVRVSLQNKDTGAFGTLYDHNTGTFAEGSAWYSVAAPKKLWTAKVNAGNSFDVIGLSNTGNVRKVFSNF